MYNTFTIYESRFFFFQEIQKYDEEKVFRDLKFKKSELTKISRD